MLLFPFFLLFLCYETRRFAYLKAFLKGEFFVYIVLKLVHSQELMPNINVDLIVFEELCPVKSDYQPHGLNVLLRLCVTTEFTFPDRQPQNVSFYSNYSYKEVYDQPSVMPQANGMRCFTSRFVICQKN